MPSSRPTATAARTFSTLKRPRRLVRRPIPPARSRRAVGAELELLGTDVGILGEPEGQQLIVAERAQFVHQPAAVLVADVDRGRRPIPCTNSRRFASK